MIRYIIIANNDKKPYNTERGNADNIYIANNIANKLLKTHDKVIIYKERSIISWEVIETEILRKDQQ